MRLRLLTVAFTSAFAVSAAGAQVIPIYGTGYNGSSTIAGGASDPHYTVKVGSGATASAVGLSPSNWCCGYTPNTATSAWVSNVDSPNTGNGNAYYATTFDLSGLDPLTATLAGVFSTADGMNGIYLNGNYLPGSTLLYTGGCTTWCAYNPFAVGAGTGWFLPGVNTLAFDTYTVNNFFDGLQVNVAGTAAVVSTTPEPGSLVLLATGLSALLGIRRRRA